MQERREHLISIGQFSLLVRLTVRALRLYDRDGLLAPAWVDPQTSYRYYTVDQTDDAEQIRLLRDVDLPLDEVRLALDDPGQLAKLLDIHEQRLRGRVQDSERALALLQRIKEGVPLVETLDIAIDIRDTAPVSGACLSTRTEQRLIGQVLGELLPRIGGVLRAAGLTGGTDFAVYPDDEFNPDDMGVVAGISLDAAVPDNDAGVVHGKYGGGRTAVATLRGPYDADGVSRVSQAWMQAWAWIAEQGHQPRFPAYEFYVRGFAESDDPSTFVTELRIPLR